jgi:hypothetical protein
VVRTADYISGHNESGNEKDKQKAYEPFRDWQILKFHVTRLPASYNETVL